MKSKEKDQSTESSQPFIIEQISNFYQNFSETGALSGLLLIVCAIAAMVWANSPWSSTYHLFWNEPLELRLGDFDIVESLHLWINDGLMTLFFFYVGLEIKREIKVGELSEAGKVALPIFAAIGGMLIPASLFYLLHRGQPGIEGWGIPMATDIAFSLGILMLLGKRVPLSLKIFLTGFAIVDDLGAVMIIALFYSKDIHWVVLGYASIFYGLMWLMKIFDVRRGRYYFLAGIGMWYFFLESGIHPTVAGVLAALAIPTNNKIRMVEFVRKSKNALNNFLDARANKLRQFLTRRQLNAIDDIEGHLDYVQPPLQRLEQWLGFHVSFIIMPLFALANAGVHLGENSAQMLTSNLTINIISSLIAGKVIGIMLFSWLSVQLGMATLPADMNWFQLFGVALLGGVGFTMALFIAGLAYDDVKLLNEAKIGILIASTIAGTTGYLVLRYALRKKPDSPRDEL